MTEHKRPRLTPAQRALLDEIDETERGVLYVRKWGRYGRTVEALMDKGYVELVEPDFSPWRQNGYRIIEGMWP